MKGDCIYFSYRESANDSYVRTILPILDRLLYPKGLTITFRNTNNYRDISINNRFNNDFIAGIGTKHIREAVVFCRTLLFSLWIKN
jgi:hypothetical protein